MKHILESDEAFWFFKSVGLNISTDSCHNSITLEDPVNGNKLTLEAESDHSIAAGIPGIYVGDGS